MGSGQLRGCNLVDDGIDPILPPRAEHDLGAVPGEKAGRGFANAAAGSGDDHHLVCDG
jgi:hypothetical protein